MVAGQLAETLRAEKLILMTNTAGVLDQSGRLITGLTVRAIDALFADGTIHSGMLHVQEQGHGEIESGHSLERNGVRYYVFVTHDRDGHARLVACAQADGRIVQSVALDRI